MFCTSAWCLDNEIEFERNVPLLLLGDSLLKHKSTKRLSVLFLEGFDKLSQKYITELNSKNIDVIDYSREFNLIKNSYPNICNYYNHYERNCFLRWIAFEKYHKENSTQQFWHIDSDIILHMSLDELAHETTHLTFMTLGCPVFLTISETKWFDTYRSELLKIESDIVDYLNINKITRDQCKKNDYKKFNISLYREPIGSDQDLLEYLISSNKIIQNEYEAIINNNIYYIQNPLVFSLMDKYLSNISTNVSVTLNNEDQILYRNKKIPFTHFQGTFCVYTAKTYLILRKLNIKSKAIHKMFLRYKFINKRFYPSLISRIILKMSKLLNINDYSRGYIINFLTKNKQGQSTELIGLYRIIREIDMSN